MRITSIAVPATPADAAAASDLVTLAAVAPAAPPPSTTLSLPFALAATPASNPTTAGADPPATPSTFSCKSAVCLFQEGKSSWSSPLELKLIVFAIADLFAAKQHHYTMVGSSHVVAASNFPDSYDDEYYNDCYYKRSS
jgi:hypothetical protein